MKKNVLHTIETRGPGGAEYVMLGLADLLNSHNYTNYGFFIKDGWIKNTFIERGYHTESHISSNNVFTIFFILIKLLRIIKRSDISVIHSHEFFMSFSASIVSCLFGVRSVCTFHGMSYHCDNWKRRLIMRFISRYSSLTVVSSEIKDKLITQASISPERIRIIENGIYIYDDVVQGGLKRELGLDSNDVLIGSVGRLNKIKGHRYFIDAAVLLVKKYSNVYFYVAGEGPARPELECLITEETLVGRFSLLGAREDIGNILASTDIFVLPSLSEGTSLALLEAMSFGVQIVATKVGNNANLVEKFPSGHLVDPEDSGQICSNIASIVDTKCYVKKDQDMIAHVRKFYSIERMLNEYISQYSI